MDVILSKNGAKPFCATLLSAPLEKIKQIFKEMLNCSKISFESIVGCRSLSSCFKCFVEFDFHNHRFGELRTCTFVMDITYSVVVFLASSLLQSNLECVSIIV